MPRSSTPALPARHVRTVGSAVAFGVALCAAAVAQDGRQPPTTRATLSPSAQATMDRLSKMSSLPAAEWRVHNGDLPHGEAIDLDDSGWTVVQARSTTGHEAAWFRRKIEVPKTLDGYDLTGSRIWFRFNVGANGPVPEILYFNGRRVALGEDLEPVVLFDGAKPGESVEVAVKLLHTNDDKRFGGAQLRIDPPGGRPNPLDLREEFRSGQDLIPWLPGDKPQMTATLESAIAAVNTKALDKGDNKAFDASLKEASAKLEPLRPAMANLQFHLTGNSHIDAAWLWPESETIDVVRRTFSTALQLMNEYPDYTYTQSAAQYNEWIAEKYPAMNEEIKRRVKEGRWEIVGGMWVEPDLNLPDGESLTRSLLLGKRFFKQQYGVDVRIGWNPDSFGYNWQLPQIYKRSGVDYFVTQKMTWNDTNQLPFKLFWWQSPDGSKVLTYFPHDYANTNLSPSRLAEDLAVARERAPGLQTMMDLYGVGDHGGGPTRTMLDEGDHWEAKKDAVLPKLQYGLAQPFFTENEGRLSSNSPVWDYKTIASGYKFPTPEDGKVVVPTWRSELYFEYHRGVQTTQANHKRNMRESEEEAVNAEKLASLAWLNGDAYPNAPLTDAWKKITFNGFHDLAAGSGIGIIYKDAQKEFDMARLETAEVSENALRTLSAQVGTNAHPGVPVLVFNPLAWAHGGPTTVAVQMPSKTSAEPVVTDPHGKVLPSRVVSKDEKTNRYTLEVLTANVPSMGYQMVYVQDGGKAPATDLKVSGTTLENANLRVVVDPKSGCITSLYDKRAKFESLAAGACGNQLQTFKDTPKNYDAWNIDPGTYDKMTPIEQVDSVKVVESGPERAAVRVSRTWGSSKFVQNIVLYANADTVAVDNDIDWHETHVLLKASFPLAATAPMASYEIPYGSIERTTTRNNTWEQAQFEVPAMRWADLGDGQHGFSLLNEAKYGYDAVGNQLRLTLLRSPTWPDPEADRGRHHFRYAVYPHAGTWQQAMTARKGYELNYKLESSEVAAHAGSLPAEHSYLSVEPENVVLTAVKKAEDSDALIFRVFEWAGKPAEVKFTVPAGATEAAEVNLMEQPVGGPLAVNGGVVSLPVKPFEIRTIRVSYPHTPMLQASSAVAQ